MQSTWTPQPRQQNPWQLGPTAGRLARWIFGLGFFSVHLGVFLIGGLTLLMINLYQSPDDLWAGGPLVRWGMVVVIHFLGAVVTWAFTTAFDAAEATRQQPAPPPRTLPRTVATQPVSNAYPPPHLMPPAEPAPARRRFSPARPVPPPTIEVAERRRADRRDPLESTQHRASPPGWTVVQGESAAAKPAAEPVIEPIEEVAEEASWTWVEAAAEAWLAGRTEQSPADAKPATGDDSP
ncbi:MAG: hypothetical protein IT334_13230 [Thermomicrobiales bacterium]|nr:hypothetical protein [Thermomicrobiales bacterium]